MQNTTKTKRINEELVTAIQAGANERIAELWEQVVGLVKWRAERVMAALEIQGNYRGIEFDDLVQTGFIAMMEAVKTFKSENGLFGTWFTFYLQSAFAEATGRRTKRGRNDPINTTTSLDRPLSDELEAMTLIDLVPDPSAEAALDNVEEKIWHEQLSEALEAVLMEIPEKSSDVLRRRYYENQTLATIGDAFDVCIESARRLELQALRELRKPRNARRLKPFYDFNVYAGTGLSSFRATGMSAQERYLINKEATVGNNEADRHI